ncbi:MAG: preprotein translocase subunit SecG [SAR324 cluster bacterium]|nr:preprotein translocase subunit SecG [SAR324 cluster bacterium]
MFSLVLILHVFVCLLIIFFVLMQSGRGAELGAAFGGVGQAQSTRSEMSGIGKATTVVAVLFMLTSLVLAYLSSEKARESVVRDIKAVPVVPGVEEPVLPATGIQIPADGVFVPPNEEEVPSKDLEQTAAPALTPSTESTQEVNNLQKAAPTESAPAQKN